MKFVWMGPWLFLAVLICPIGAAAQDAKAADTFVRGLYRRYQTQKDFSPFFDGPTVRSIFTPALATLVKQDQEASAASQEVGALDFDPVSGSQDPTGLRLADVKFAPDQPGRAVVTVDLRFGKEQVTRRLLLVAVKGEWRIDDITDGKGHDGVRAILTRAAAAAHTPTRRR